MDHKNTYSRILSSEVGILMEFPNSLLSYNPYICYLISLIIEKTAAMDLIQYIPLLNSYSLSSPMLPFV